MATAEDEDETANLLNTLALEIGQSTGNTEGNDLNISASEAGRSVKNKALFDELKPSFEQSQLQAVLVSLLQDIVKPKLSAYKHAKLTDQGTQRIRPREVDVVKEEIDPPKETISILIWVSENIEKPTIQAYLHLILPPILILLDSSHTRIRTRATMILSNILERIDESILAKTGLAEVIWSAIFPNLTSLPPITDLEDSAALLRVTYPALITLTKLWHPPLPERIPLLDRVVREGVIYAMLFSGVKLKVVEVELESLESLIYEMGIYFVKHLKHIIPVISSILANPLGSNHPPQLLLALQVLEAILSICWPRIPSHHAEILRGTTTCWRYLRNQDSPELVPVPISLKRITQALIACSPEAKIDVELISSVDSYYAELQC